MARELRGTRYLGNDPELGHFISQELPYLDFEETLDFYEYFETVRATSDRDRALLGCNDRYYLLTILCHRKDAFAEWIFNRCREVESNPDGHLDLWARYHYKSTICTFAGLIQEVMVDPEITCAIMSGTNKVAQPFLKQIMEEFESNEDLKRIYSDVLWEEPRKQAPQWSISGGIIVRRRGNPKEATIEAFGLIDGMRTGKHYQLLDYDDLIDESMVDNPDIVKKVTTRWELSDNLGTLGITRKWHQGTRYSYADTYGIIIDRAILKTRIHPATENGQLNGKPVMLTEKRWAEIKTTQRSTVAAQMLLNPLAGNENTFTTLALKHYDVIPSVMNVYIMCDPSKGKTKRSDRTAIAVIGYDLAGNKYLLDGFCHRMKLSRRYELITQLREKWLEHPGVQMVRVGYEQYGLVNDIEVIKEYQERDENYFEIVELSTPREGKHSKTDRIERLQPDFNRNLFYIPAVVYHPEFGGKHNNSALWDVWTEDDKKLMDEAGNTDPTKNPSPGTIIYRRMDGPTRLQRAMEARFESHRIVHAIRRRNEDGDIYDLTRMFIEEYRLVPFAPHDDLIDAVSRIFDMEPIKPVMIEAGATQPRTYADS